MLIEPLIQGHIIPGAVIIEQLFDRGLDPRVHIGVVRVFYLATNLTPPVFWNPVTNEPATLGNMWSMSVATATNVAGYYRLQAP